LTKSKLNCQNQGKEPRSIVSSIKKEDLSDTLLQMRTNHKEQLQNIQSKLPSDVDISEDMMGDQKLQWVKRQNKLLRDQMKRIDGGNRKRKLQPQEKESKIPKRKRVYNFQESQSQ